MGKKSILKDKIVIIWFLCYRGVESWFEYVWKYLGWKLLCLDVCC